MSGEQRTISRVNSLNVIAGVQGAWSAFTLVSDIVALFTQSKAPRSWYLALNPLAVVGLVSSLSYLLILARHPRAAWTVLFVPALFSRGAYQILRRFGLFFQRVPLRTDVLSFTAWCVLVVFLLTRRPSGPPRSIILSDPESLAGADPALSPHRRFARAGWSFILAVFVDEVWTMVMNSPLLSRNPKDRIGRVFCVLLFFSLVYTLWQAIAGLVLAAQSRLAKQKRPKQDSPG